MPVTAPARSLSPERIPSLDGLRAASILLVLLGHDAGQIRGLPAWIAGWFGYGSQAGVDVFFVLSGFLITRLLMQQHRPERPLPLGRFYLRRAFRIWPAFYVYLAAVAILAAAGAFALGRGEWWAAALFVWSYDPNARSWFLGQTWTLAIEEQFYLIWPGCVRWMRRRPLTIAAGIVILVSPLLRIAVFAWLPAARSHIVLILPTRLDTLMFGALPALLYDRFRFQRLLRQLFRRGLGPASAGALAVNPLLVTWLHGGYQRALGISLEGAAAAGLMLWAVAHHHSAAGRLLNWRPVVHLGIISYSLYLWQQMFLGDAHAVWHLPLGVDMLCALAAAELSYRFIERPMLRLRGRIVPGSARSAAGRIALHSR